MGLAKLHEQILDRNWEKSNELLNRPGDQSQFRLSARTVTESEYLEGLFEYLYGIHLETLKEPLFKNHLDRSFSILKPYSSDLAHTVRTLIALKWNWFSVLKSLPSRSVFYLTGEFFNKSYKTLVHRRYPPPPSDVSCESGVLVDTYTYTCMLAIHAFMAGDILRMGAWMDKLKMHPWRDVSDIYQDKYALLSARFHRRVGHVKQAKAAYRVLVEHPDFKNEAEEFLNG